MRKGLQFKSVQDDGFVLAVIATLNVVDKDGDLTLPGFFGEQEVVMLPAHDWKSVPIGKGKVKEVGNQAVAEIRMNLDIEDARKWHSALKFDMAHGRPLQEWSYGFTIMPGGSSDGEENGRRVRYLRAAPDGTPGARVHEVSPVVVGAGEGTGTLAVKDAKGAFGPHRTPTVDAAWDGPANVARARSGEGEAYYRRIFAWKDPQGEAGNKGSYKFPHHQVGSGGDPGAANVRALIAGIAVLNGGRGGADIPAGDREGVYRHLAAHLRDAGFEPAPLKAAPGPEEDEGMKFCDEVEAAVSAVEGLVQRAESLADLRAKEGRGMSAANRGRLADLRARLGAASEALAPLAKADDDSARAARVELGRFLRGRANIAGGKPC